MPETLTSADLKRALFIVYGLPLNARDATDAQFDAWVREQMKMTWLARQWTVEERVRFCDLLRQHGDLKLTEEYPT
jgi:hypothetical protein